MMKKTSLILAALCAFSPLAFAQTSLESKSVLTDTRTTPNYFSEHQKLGSIKNKLKKMMTKPTEVIINNASYNDLYVYQIDNSDPNDPYRHVIGSAVIKYRGFAHFRDRAYVTTPYIEFFLPGDDRPFVVGTFCPYASVTVYGYAAKDVIVDDIACKPY
jgi:tRNA nucleotidyltransferase (CCA-adding enzyme)